MASRKNDVVVEIEYRGEKLKAFDWVRWVGTDFYGNICGFENKPVKFQYPDDSWDNSWDIANHGDRWSRLKFGAAYEKYDDWENSLVEIKCL